MARVLSCLAILLLLLEVALPRICPSMDIRNDVSRFARLQECDVIEGFLQVVLIESGTELDFANLSFPRLREVTGFVLFNRVHGLTSIGPLFPSLAVIRGHQLFIDYAFVVSQMPNLQEIALSSLKVILRGSVAVFKNPMLCFVETVNWTQLSAGGDLFISSSSDNSLCPSCGQACPSGHCWSTAKCQNISSPSSPCHFECAGGCTGPRADQCTTCKHYLYKKTCVKRCPPDMFEYENIRCVTREECQRMNETLARPGSNEPGKDWFVFGNSCVNTCPKCSKYDDIVGCRSYMGRCECAGLRIDSLQDAQEMKDCTHILGSIEIQIRTRNHSFVQAELENNLGDIEEIDGYLKIVHSNPLTSLNFLKKLRSINGNLGDSYKDRYYTFIVIDNQNLHTLWNWNERPGGRNFSIKSGRVFFHHNPHLCFRHIMELTEIANMTKITNLEVAKESNGNKFACNILNIEVQVFRRYTNSFALLIDPPKFHGQNKHHYHLIRYIAYYIKAPYKNVTMQYETEECAVYRWNISDVISYPDDDVSLNGSVYHMIVGLEPDTQYAFFIRTYTLASTAGQSSIKYVKTLPSKPSWPNYFTGFSSSSDTIVLNWEPPENPNGQIVEYIVRWYLRSEEIDMLSHLDYCLPNSRDVFIKEKTEPSTLPPDMLTLVGNATEDCCEKGADKNAKREAKLKKPEHICRNGKTDGPKISSVYLSKMKETLCEKFMYQTIENKIIERPQSVKRSTDSGRKSFMNSIDQYVPEERFGNFSQYLPGNVTSLIVKDLTHYSLYTITIKACRKIDPYEPNVNSDTRCSISSIITLRTLAKSNAEEIVLVQTHIRNRTVELKWTVPESPNLYIVNYDVEYRRTDIQHFKPVVNCIKADRNMMEARYILEGLSVGHYSFRVRAISLAGIGNYTPSIDIFIGEKSRKNIILIAIFICFMVTIFTFVLVFLYNYRKKWVIRRNTILIASVNPEYMGLPLVDEEWELPRDKIQIIKELKRGNFGIVCEGLLVPEEQIVAVKKVVETASERDCIEFLNEASVMKQFVSAYHIVKLIGIVSKDWPQLVVMEMMENGDLKSYLRECRNAVSPTPQQMLLMAAQIADGMAFLEGKKYVHRDLAARNCMVRKDLVVKIGDFGMTRDVYETDYYRKGNKGLLPIRWMAPESLNDGVFTNKSDVWSYGIVLWEMATLASQPYQGMSNEQVLNYVVSGNKLSLPLFYPKPFKNIMQWCWRWKPKFRPCFLQILSELSEFTTKSFREESYYESEAGKTAREVLASEPQECYLEPSSSSACYHRDTR